MIFRGGSPSGSNKKFPESRKPRSRIRDSFLEASRIGACDIADFEYFELEN